MADRVLVLSSNSGLTFTDTSGPLQRAIKLSLSTLAAAGALADADLVGVSQSGVTVKTDIVTLRPMFRQWDGGATGLTAATGRTSLGLGTIATQAANAVAITGGTVAGLTSITVTGASGNTVVIGTTGLVYDAANSRVGVGTASPAARLHVKGASNATTGGILIQGTSNNRAWFYPIDTFNLGIKLAQSAGNIRFLTSADGEFARLDPTTANVSWINVGNLGIGTATPGAYKVNVNGSLKASSYWSSDGSEGGTISYVVEDPENPGDLYIHVAKNGLLISRTLVVP